MMTSSLRQGGDGGGGNSSDDIAFASPSRQGTQQMQMLDGKTPRVTNSNAGGNRAEDDCGVAVDGLTASLLGIHFLPFTPLPGGDGAALPENRALQQQHRHRQHEYSHLLPALPAMTTSPQQEATRGHRSTPNDTNGGANLYFSDLGDNSTLTEDPADAVGRSKRSSSGIGGGSKVGKSSRKRIKGAFKSIKKSIVRGSKSKKAGVGTAATDADVLGRGTNTTSTSSSPASGGGQSPISMSSSSADLSRLQRSADEATRRARALTERIESKTEEIAALERRLASCREALARDVADLDSLREDIDALQRRRREVERSNADSSGGGASSRPNAQTAAAPVSSQLQQLKPKPEAVRRLSSFIRIHDLDLAQDAGAAAATGQGSTSNAADSSADGSGNRNNLNRAYSLSVQVSEVQTGSTRPDLADVHGSTIAPAIVEALARMAYDAATDDATDRWTPSADTKKALGKQTDLVVAAGSQNASVLVSAGGAPWIHVPPKEVFVWHGKFEHGGFGSDLPVVKARGLVFCSAQELVSLLLDSTRTKEYNKMSIGRTDEHYFHRNALPGVTDEMPGAAACGNETNTEDDTCWEELPGETRILRSLSKPPMVKPVELLTLYHARELDAAAGQIDGYLIVSRSIWETECGVPTEEGGGKKSDSSATRTEMLLGAQLVRSVDNADRPQCELTTINHLSSKSIPMMMAKKVGLMTAASFIRDIQGVFE